MDRRLAFWRSVKFKKAAFLAVGTGVILFMAFGGQDWRTASRASSGLALRPEEEQEAVVQVYAARTFNWRGYFAVHTWIALKEKTRRHIPLIRSSAGIWAGRELPSTFVRTFPTVSGTAPNRS